MLLEERFILKKQCQVMQVNMKDTKKPAHGFVRFRLYSAPNNLKTDICPFSNYWEQISDIFVRRFLTAALYTN